MYLLMKDFEAAISDYSRVLQLHPNDVLAYKQRGKANLELSRLEEAKRDFEKAKAILSSQQGEENSKSVSVDYELGLVAYLEENYEEAVTYFSLAAKSQPDENILFRRALAYAEIDEYENALTDCKEIIEMNNNVVPDNVHMLIAECLFGLCEYKHAIDAFTSSLEQGISNRLKLGEAERAVIYVKRAYCFWNEFIEQTQREEWAEVAELEENGKFGLWPCVCVCMCACV